MRGQTAASTDKPQYDKVLCCIDSPLAELPPELADVELVGSHAAAGAPLVRPPAISQRGQLDRRLLRLVHELGVRHL